MQLSFSVVQEVDLYWRKLLEVCAVERLQVRCRSVVPENYARLPAHMSLTAKLLASPRALTRIQLYCKNRPGYIVPGVLGGEEVWHSEQSLTCALQCSGEHGLMAEQCIVLHKLQCGGLQGIVWQYNVH